jgi:hypothetical protein
VRIRTADPFSAVSFVGALVFTIWPQCAALEFVHARGSYGSRS